MNDRCLILLAHGSRDPEWKESFEQLARQLCLQLGPTSVRCAFLQFTDPTVRQAVEEIHAQGIRHFRILPMFLAVGGHVRNDLPALTAELQKEYPDCTIDLLPAIAESPILQDCLLHIARINA